MVDPSLNDQIARLAVAVTEGKITQSEIAKATGVHQSQVSRILSGRSRRASSNVYALCRFADARFPTRNTKRPGALTVEALIGELFTTGRPAEAAAVRRLLQSLLSWRRSWRSSE